MKTENAKFTKWMRRISGLLATLMITMSFAGQASAMILFQDDDTHDIDSEGITINSDDTIPLDQDVTFQLGNDGTDATMTFDDGTGSLTIAAPGDVVVGSGTGLNFSGSDMFRIREHADPEGGATCTVLGELIYDTTDDKLQICTTVGVGATSVWADVDTASSDADTLDSIDSTSFLRSDTSDSFTSGTLTLDSGTTLTVNGIANIGDGGDTVAINSSDWDISTTGAMTGISGITNDSTLTTSGGAVSVNASSNFTTAINTGTSTGAVTIGGGSNTVAIDTTSWDISSGGAATGFTGLTSTGAIDFSGASRLALHSGGTNPATCTEGDIFYNTGGDTTYICTDSTLNTWTALSTGGADTFESVYAADGDNTLTASSTFNIDAVGAVGIDSDAGLTLGGTTIGLTADGGILSLAGDGTNDIDITNTGAAIDIGSATYTLDTTAGFSIDGGAASNVTTSAGAITVSGGDGVSIDGTGQEVDVTTTGGTIDMNSASLTVDTTAGISLDGAAASNFTTSSGALTLDGNGGVNIAGNAAEVDVTTTGAVDINSGAFTLDASTTVLTTSSTFGIDATGAVTIDSDAATTLGGSTVGIDSDGGAVSINNNVNQAVNVGTGTSTGAVSVGGGSNTVAINTTSWDVSSAGIGSGFTGFTSTGTVNFSGAGSFRIREVAGITNPGTTCTTVGELIMDTTNDVLYTCTNATTNAWTSTSAKVDTMVFEPEYPNYVLWPDTTLNSGKMEALYDSTNGEQYYRWTTKKNDTHDYDVRFRYTLPDDFVSAGDMTLEFRNDSITLSTDNWVNVTIRNDTDGVGGTTCHADGEVQATAANTWETLTITKAEIETGCTAGNVLSAGDVVEVIIKMGADNAPNSGGTDVGTLTFDYNN